MQEKRPDPDELLKQINKQEEQEHSGKGRLKIFFGYAAGVGKTFAMLDTAHSTLKAGTDLVVGYVEPHTRPETIALLEGLEIIPPLNVEYKGITLKEFDLDAVLKRKPQVVLVDELAHTNAQGCRHKKRFQDIEELLQAGIDVYTTVNVQHLESLNDIVASITQVIVRERIPDYIFDKADQVELVDIEPDDLMERLMRGKIYKERQAKKALGHFFTKENLIALREIALRRTADRVNKLAENSKKPTSGGEYYAGEHILICLSSSPSNAKVIRTGARMANSFHASFTALYVETPGTKEMCSDNLARLRENIRLAKDLGAKISTAYGENIPYQIAEYTKVNSVSTIVMGRSNNTGGLFRTKPKFVDQLTELAPNLDVHIIPDNLPKYDAKKEQQKKKMEVRWLDLGKMIGIIALCTLIGLGFENLGVKESNIITMYILGVLICATLTQGRIYGILGSFVSVLAFNFFFTDPRMTLHMYDPGYPLTVVVMLASSLITSTLTMRVKSQAKLTAQKAHRMEILLETSRKLQRAKNVEDIYKRISVQLVKLLNKDIIIYPVEEDHLEAPILFPQTLKEQKEYKNNLDEYAVANWVYKNRKPAGISTDTLPGAKAYYLPVGNRDGMFAVVGIAIEKKEDLDPLDQSILISMLNEFHFVLEKYDLNEKQKQVSMQAERERLRSNLLRAISHDLRTPLTSISGNASVLLSNGDIFDKETRRQLYEDIYDDSLWLINLVENLLSVTRIENGTMNINRNPELLSEVIGEALQHINRKKTEHQIEVEIPDDMLMARVDASLIVQVVINIVDNAIKYTDTGSIIKISAFKKHRMAVIEIADNGNGVLDEDKEKLFDMFFTANNNRGDSRRGLGLGLSLCESIVIAHGGQIYVRDNIPKGTIFGFTLELEEVYINENDSISG